MTDDHTAIKPMDVKEITTFYGQDTPEAALVCCHEANLRLIKQIKYLESLKGMISGYDSVN